MLYGFWADRKTSIFLLCHRILNSYRHWLLMCKQLVYWHIFAHHFAFFENFINFFDFYVDFFHVKSLLGVGASSLNADWIWCFDSWPYMFEIINEGVGESLYKMKIRLSAEIFRLRPWIIALSGSKNSNRRVFFT